MKQNTITTLCYAESLNGKFHFNVVLDNGIVRFYDSRYTEGFTPMGQFVSSYMVETILNGPVISGLCLDGGIPDWSVSLTGMERVYNALTQE